MNQFALRAQILDKMKQKEADEEEEQKKGRKSGLVSREKKKGRDERERD